MQVGFNYKNKKIKIDVEKCNSFGRVRGLMFRRRKNAPVLLFEFRKPVRIAIHSLFVFFPFWAVWLDDKSKIVEEKIVQPWRFHVAPKKKFYKLIEIPLNNRYKLLFPDED